MAQLYPPDEEEARRITNKWLKRDRESKETATKTQNSPDLSVLRERANVRKQKSRKTLSLRTSQVVYD